MVPCYELNTWVFLSRAVIIVLSCLHFKLEHCNHWVLKMCDTDRIFKFNLQRYFQHQIWTILLPYPFVFVYDISVMVLTVSVIHTNLFSWSDKDRACEVSALVKGKLVVNSNNILLLNCVTIKKKTKWKN